MDTFSQINIMLVFGVKYRLGLLAPEMREHVHALIGRIINDHGKGSRPICIGGTADHVHILLSLSTSISIADLTREIKSRSSRWINERRLTLGRFGWQNGYGAFSYSQSARPQVIEYIKNQEAHHRTLSFREELERFLELYNLTSDPRDLPDAPQ